MSVVYDDVRLLLLIVFDQHASEIGLLLLALLNENVGPSTTCPLDFSPPDWTRDNAVSEHSKTQKRQRNTFGKKDAPNEGWHVCKCIANTSDNEVLKGSCFLHKGTASLNGEKVSFANKLVGNDESFKDCQHQQIENVQHVDSPINGSAGISHLRRASRPT